MKTNWKKLWTAAFLFFLLFGVGRMPAVFAANLQAVSDKPVKIGSFYYKSGLNTLPSGNMELLLQRSKSKTGSYARVWSAQTYSGFFTDGETVCYLVDEAMNGGMGKRALYTYVIGSKKPVKLQSFTMKSPYGIQISVGGQNIYITSKTTPMAAYRLWSYNLSSGKWKTLLKSALVWDYDTSRYLVYSTSKKALKGDLTATGAGPIYVLDKNTGIAKVAVKRGTTAIRLPVAASEDNSPNLKKYQVIAVPSASGTTWSIQKYTFSTGKLKTLKTLKKVKSVDMMFLNGSRVSVSYTTTSGKEKTITVKVS